MPLPKRVLQKADSTNQSDGPMSRWQITCDLDRTDMVLGVDPGLLGGFAIFDCSIEKFVGVHSAPTVKGTSKRNTYDIESIIHTLRDYVCDKYATRRFTFCIERQQPMAYQGLVSTFTTGYGYGMWMGVFHGLQTVKPQIVVVRAEDWQHIIWKEHAAKDETKAKSIARVHRLFPDVDLTAGGRSKRDLDGKADACNIAHYAFLRMVQDDPDR